MTTTQTLSLERFKAVLPDLALRCQNKLVRDPDSPQNPQALDLGDVILLATPKEKVALEALLASA